MLRKNNGNEADRPFKMSTRVSLVGYYETVMQGSLKQVISISAAFKIEDA